MTNFVTVSELKASSVSCTGVTIKRFDGDFTIRNSYKGYEVITAKSKQRIGNFSDIKSVKKFLTNF